MCKSSKNLIFANSWICASHVSFNESLSYACLIAVHAERIAWYTKVSACTQTAETGIPVAIFVPD